MTVLAQNKNGKIIPNPQTVTEINFSIKGFTLITLISPLH